MAAEATKTTKIPKNIKKEKINLLSESPVSAPGSRFSDYLNLDALANATKTTLFQKTVINCYNNHLNRYVLCSNNFHGTSMFDRQLGVWYTKELISNLNNYVKNQ